MTEKGNMGSREMDKIMKGLILANVAIILSSFISIGFYMKTVQTHTDSIKQTEDAVKLVDTKSQIIEQQANKRMTEIASAGIARDNANEKSVIVIEGKLGRIEDKLDVVLTDLKEIKKTVFKSAIGSTDVTNMHDVAISVIAKQK